VRAGDGPLLCDAALRDRKVPGNRSPSILRTRLWAGAPSVRIPGLARKWAKWPIRGLFLLAITDAERADREGCAVDERELPKFDYYVDESDTDILVLRRQDGTFVAAFSAGGATTEGLVEAAEKDYRALLCEHGRSPTAFVIKIEPA